MPGDTPLPTEVELVYELMPCFAARTVMEPLPGPHPCTYFAKWGTYHSYDYETAGPPPTPDLAHDVDYVGRARLVPEMLSGCRKAPIMAVGINPNLPGWWGFSRNALNPLFDDYRQYAHYFRYRSVAKLALSTDDYAAFGGGAADTPASQLTLRVPADASGHHPVRATLQPQKMYEAYQGLLDSLAEALGWPGGALAVGEDLTYGNMVACPSARWTTVPLPAEPDVPPMSKDERAGIVRECFHTRRYFLRQLFQSLPSVLLVFSQTTASAFVAEMRGRFVLGAPAPDETLDALAAREVRLHYGDLPDGTSLEARVIFAPHITGNPEDFGAARGRVVAQLVEEAAAGRLRFNAQTRHLTRSAGACVFCTMLQIGPCPYRDELRPIADVPTLAADSPAADLLAEKAQQAALLGAFPRGRAGTPEAERLAIDAAWSGSDETAPGDPSRDA